MTEAKSNYIVPIVIGIFAALFSNFDRVFPEILNYFNSNEKVENIEWLSVYRDVTEKLDDETIVNGNFNFVLDGNALKGAEDTSSTANRNWEIKGKIHKDWVKNKNQGPFYLFNYKSVSTKKERASIGTVLLEPVTHALPQGIKEYQGYWLGHEPDLNKLMVCPYILSSDNSATKIGIRNQQWLAKSCAYRT